MTESEFTKQLYDNITIELAKNNMTQRELSLKLGKSAGYIALSVCRESCPSSYVLMQICKIFNVTAESLTGCNIDTSKLEKLAMLYYSNDSFRKLADMLISSLSDNG